MLLLLIMGGTTAASSVDVGSSTGTGTRVLALIGSGEIRSSHSQFFKGLADAGLDVDVRGHKEDGLAVRRFDRLLYDHVVLFAPHANGERPGRAPVRGPLGAACCCWPGHCGWWSRHLQSKPRAQQRAAIPCLSDDAEKTPRMLRGS